MRAGPPLQVRAGDWAFDGAARQLVRAGEPVAITPKAFDLLGALLEARPRALSKAELMERLWPGTFVTAASLAQLVTEVRRLLGDSARAPRYVRTVHRYGYAFCGEALPTEAAEAPVRSDWLIAWGSREVMLPEGESLIGRAPDVLVRINALEVSRHHARIRLDTGPPTLEDLGSKNGTFVEGKRIDGPTVLRSGDQVVVGPAVLTVNRSSGATSTRRGGATTGARRRTPRAPG